MDDERAVTAPAPLPTPAFEPFEHTADVGIVAYGRTLEELFANASLGMFAQIWEVEPLPKLTETREVTVQAPDRELLLHAWLARLLFIHDVEDLLFGEFEVFSVGETEASGQAHGVPMESAADRLKTEIKAVTYHALEIAQVDSGYRATILFDV